AQLRPALLAADDHGLGLRRGDGAGGGAADVRRPGRRVAAAAAQPPGVGRRARLPGPWRRPRRMVARAQDALSRAPPIPAPQLIRPAPTASTQTKKRSRHAPGSFWSNFGAAAYCLRAIAELPSPIDFSTVLTAFMYIENSWLSAVRRAVAPAATFSSELPASLALATMLLARSPSFSPSASAIACSQLVWPLVEPLVSPLELTFSWARLFSRALNSALMVHLLGNWFCQVWIRRAPPHGAREAVSYLEGGPRRRRERDRVMAWLECGTTSAAGGSCGALASAAAFWACSHCLASASPSRSTRCANSSAICSSVSCSGSSAPSNWRAIAFRSSSTRTPSSTRPLSVLVTSSGSSGVNWTSSGASRTASRNAPSRASRPCSSIPSLPRSEDSNSWIARCFSASCCDWRAVASAPACMP